MESRTASSLAQTATAVLKQCTRLLPRRVRKHLDDRLFYAIFQVSRVTNDHYPTRD